MRLVGNPEVVECSATTTGAAVVVVGVKLDAWSRELLTWALVKVAQSGDRVIALHIIDHSTEGKASLLSLVKTFDSVLAAYEGFCNLKQLLDPNLINAYDYEQFEKMVFAAILCVRRAPQSCPQISLILKLLQGDPEVLEWATEQVHALEEVDSFDGEQLGTNLQSFINLALLNFEEGSASSSSTEQNILVEDYLQGRWSRSSSFD
ncbi:Protein kinase protein with adenine nucleotide alpha hydrolase-like domain [Abeliophyllum distichum]|uniref:Protein kinase protein with adenine nucleotide alpha hydrolase-like domain n=1 Tax=Abeliophyllum distichum TaxID=126358 RepID=A0ABD1TZA6_9LAMI